ncbi:MAG: ABC transporter permease [Bacteroidetes bacterium]|nr:MAG: ABC transporter permease [Bacteroidota bacterium]
MTRILTYSCYDLLRSRWSYAYFLFYLITTLALLYFSSDLSKAIISLMNIVLILSPLIGTMLGAMYSYNSREFVELLLAQPIRRRDIFLGQYLGLAGSLSLSFALGMGIPFLIYGVQVSAEVWNFATLLFSGVMLTFIFSGLAFWIAMKQEDKTRGFGTAILLWLFLAIVYDGIFLLALILFEAWPLEKFALAASLFNPIDLSRILIMLKLDISALLGYTGAVFQQFAGSTRGMFICVLSLLAWAALPVAGFLYSCKRKDF